MIFFLLLLLPTYTLGTPEACRAKFFRCSFLTSDGCCSMAMPAYLANWQIRSAVSSS